jgi:hypothetical protein
MRQRNRPVVTHHDHHTHVTIIFNAPLSHKECEMLKEKLGSVCQVEQKQKPPQQKKKPHSSARQLPPELNTAEARRYLDKAKALGLIDKHYRWLKGKQLLACFCHDMSVKLHLGKGERIAWLPFEIFFGIKKLRLSYNDIQKTGSNPSDIGLVDSIFQ